MDLYSKIIQGDTNALSKAITLVESTLENDKKESQKLLSKCIQKEYNSVRIGITGIPGVGKSSFIEQFGTTFLRKKKKVAVLAIDPSSEKTQGSILGDKSRMQILANNKNVFIRPSSNSGILGGVSNNTKDSIILCEAAGYDIIIIETVGVGQSETIVNQLVDIMLLLTITGAGDRLQGIKKGINELANLIIITKDDGDNQEKVKEAMLDYKSIISLNIKTDANSIPKVFKCSSHENTGIKEINIATEQYIQKSKETNLFNTKRTTQKIYWINKILKEELGNRKYNKLKQTNMIIHIEDKIIKEKKNLFNLIANL
jgi:LAO/AO transport system kinase